MKILNNANHLTGTVLAALACVAFVGCSNNDDRVATTSDTTRSVSTDSTASNTTIAADDTPKTLDNTGEVPPAAADTSSTAGSESGTASTETSTTTETKSKKSMKHKAKKAKHKAHSAWNDATTDDHNDDFVVNDNESDDYVYDTDMSNTSDTDSMDVSSEQTVSGVTTAPDTYREDGLSPFAQEPNSRMPKQIGSGQLTGEDKSTTILEGPSLFQDPSALGRDLIH